MRGITFNYFIRRLGIFFLTIWIAGTIIWLIPHLAPGDPISAMVARMASRGGFVENADVIIKGWKERFGLKDPLPVQYVRYLGNLIHLDFGYSMANFPTPVSQLIGDALPWTVGLLLLATTMTFVLGNFLGAIMVWRRTPRMIKYLIPVGMMFTSLPSILAALFLAYVFAFLLNWFPLIGSYDMGMKPGLNGPFIECHPAWYTASALYRHRELRLLDARYARHDDYSRGRGLYEFGACQRSRPLLHAVPIHGSECYLAANHRLCHHYWHAGQRTDFG